MDLIKSEKGYVLSAKDLHKELGMKKTFSTWIKTSIERAYLEIGTDFTPHREESTGGRPSTDYLLTKDSAIQIIIMSGGQFAKKLRDKVVELYNQHDTGLAFTSSQIEALMDLSKAMTLISIQKNVEKKHFAIYNDKYSWHRYRAALLGYDIKDVIKAMQQVNKKHSTMRTSLIKLDAVELIRVGVIDFMKAMGKSDEYATNVGGLCKSMASKMELGNIIWDDTIDNPLKINQAEVTERQTLYTGVQKML